MLKPDQGSRNSGYWQGDHRGEAYRKGDWGHTGGNDYDRQRDPGYHD